MNTVITISLAGRSYALEELGYSALKTYLDQAAKNLENNPDKEEIIKDFELAVAEKCERYLNASKNVITEAEVQTIIKEMGPVESNNSNTDKKSTDDHQNESRPKKLYRLREGEMISGVCTGLAAYFNLDVTLVRIIFLILAIITHGAWIAVYVAMVILVPIATTDTEKAKAFGTTPLTASDLIKKAKDGYGNFKNSKEWKHWKQQLREERKHWKYEQRRYTYRPSPFYELMGSIMGFMWVAFFIFIIWFGYNHISIVHDAFNALGIALRHFSQFIATKFGAR